MDRLGVLPENRAVVAILYFSFFTSGMMSILLGALLPHIKQAYGLDYTRSGMLLSAHQIGNLCALVFAGVLPYAIGRKNSTMLLGSGLTIGLVGMTLTGNPLLLLVAFVLTGISRGTWSNICNTVIGEASANKTAALNILHAIFAVGALLSPLMVYFHINLFGLGWRGAAQTVGVLGLLALILVALSPLPGKGAAPAKAAREEKRETGGVADTLRTPSFWLATGILFFYLGAEASIIGWFVTYFTDAGILTPGMAAFTPTMLWLMIMIGRIVCATYSSRFDKNKLILGMGIAFSAFFAVMLVSKNSTVSVVCLLGIGLSMAGIYPTTFSTVKDSSTVATGLCLGIATLAAIILPSVVGAVADLKGLSGGVAVIFSFCAGMLALMAVNLLRARRLAAVAKKGG